MDRRTTLNILIGRNNPSPGKEKRPKTAVSTLPPDSGFEPYIGEWGIEQAAHLLRRTTFGATYAEIKAAVTNGLDTTIATLLEEKPLPSPPLNYNQNDDPNVSIGEPWIDAIYTAQSQQGSRRRSLNAWTMGQMLNDGISIREKMVLFWHNHFVTQMSVVQDAKYLYLYSTTLRENAIGNFKNLVKAITIDPAMLRYLNGNQNSKFAPNENYARELLELFTIGKGELAGPGDYTTFTEDDVVEIAKVLTGWRDLGYFTQEEGVTVGAVFLPFRHDTTTKQLSHRFNNITISDAGDQEYSNLIDIIFQQDEVARFICRKLYRWFVYYEIDDTVESEIIEPMAQLLIINGYNITPVLEGLLKSAHFYDLDHQGCMIKNPLDFIISIFRQFEIPVSEQLFPQYQTWFTISRFSPQLQMEYYEPPNVAGWKAFYQAPAFYQIWLNSVTLPIRMDFTTRIVMQGYQIAGQTLIIDALDFLSKIDDPADVNNVINEFVQILLPRAVTENQHAFLKEVLIPGLPDYEWTAEYTDYINDPGNEPLANSVRTKVRNLFTTILTMSEYYLG